jgi:hypothetical protein
LADAGNFPCRLQVAELSVWQIWSKNLRLWHFNTSAMISSLGVMIILHEVSETGNRRPTVSIKQRDWTSFVDSDKFQSPELSYT